MKVFLLLTVAVAMVIVAECSPRRGGGSRRRLGGRRGYRPTPSPLNPDEYNEEVTTAMGLLNDRLEETEGDDYQERTLVTVVSAHRQVVSGTRFFFVFEVSGGSIGENERCRVALWNRSWLEEESERNQLVGQPRCRGVSEAEQVEPEER